MRVMVSWYLKQTILPNKAQWHHLKSQLKIRYRSKRKSNPKASPKSLLYDPAPYILRHAFMSLDYMCTTKETYAATQIELKNKRIIKLPKKENILSSQIVHISTSLQQNQLW